MSKFAAVLLCALVSALVFSSASDAKAVSKYCKLIPPPDLARPVKADYVRTTSISVRNPSLTKATGRLTLCSHRVAGSVVAQTSVASLNSAGAARKEFAAIIHGIRGNHVKTTKLHGPWVDGYFMGEDGLLVLKGRYMFHIQYASGAPGYSRITSKTLARLAAEAVRKL